MNHIRRIKTRILPLLMATALTGSCGSALPVHAARKVTESTIDTTLRGSITIHKLISNDGYASYADGIGHDVNDTDLSSSGDGMQPLDGVIFSYKKVADLVQIAGDGGVGLYFQNIDPDFRTAVLGYNWTAAENRTVINGETCYTTAQMEAALAAGNNHPGNALSQTGETALTDYLIRHGTKMPACESDGTSFVTDLPLGLYLVGETDISAHDGRADNALSILDEVTGQTKSYAKGDYYLEDPNPEAPVVASPAAPYYIVLPTTNITVYEGHEPGSVWIYDVDSWPKDQTLSVTKKIIDPDERGTRSLRDYEDYQIGDTVEQVIFADAPALMPALTVPAEDGDGNPTNVPAQDAKTHSCYIISDQMTKGLSFDRVTRVAYGPKVSDPATAEAFSGFKTLKAGTDYKVTDTVHGTKSPVSGPNGAQSFAVELLPAGLQKLDAISEMHQVAVFFEATLNKDAKIGPALEGELSDLSVMNENHPALTWRNSNTLERQISGNHVYDFTYALDLTKKGISKGNSAKAAFTAVRHDTKGGASDHQSEVRFVEEEAGVYHVYDEHHKDAANDESRSDTQTGTAYEAAKVLRPDADGHLLIKGLDSNRYTFREISTEQGKALLKSTFDVVFTADDPLRDGQLSTAKAEVTDASGTDSASLRHAFGIAYLVVNNYKSLTLRTGGIGRYLLWASGGMMFLVLAAGSLILRRRRKLLP